PPSAIGGGKHADARVAVGACVGLTGPRVGGGGYTVYAGTGAANTSSDSYAGIGVLASTDGGTTWSRIGGSALNGALIFRLVQNGGKILAATSHGLFSFDGTSWASPLHPACDPTVPASSGGCAGNVNLKVGNVIT